MNLNQTLNKYRNRVAESLNTFLDKRLSDLKNVNSWGEDVTVRLREFSTRGKLLRGSLILLSSDMYYKTEVYGNIEAASAIELIHSSLLIHDDIMDRDELRRGGKTLHRQYNELYPGNNPAEAMHFGESMAISSADIGFFLAFYLLSTSSIESRIIRKIIELWSMEFSYVGAAQMDDMYFEVNNGYISAEKILNMYRYKTSRYTFSLPLITGAILANASEKEIDKLKNLGEKMGIIFQIKDDELGLFGKEDKTGKPTGSDIQEGKNTLYISYLKKMVTDTNRKSIEQIILKRDGSDKAIEKLKEIIVSSGIKKRIDELIDQLRKEAYSIIKSLNIQKIHQNLLYDLVDYINEREK